MNLMNLLFMYILMMIKKTKRQIQRLESESLDLSYNYLIAPRRLGGLCFCFWFSADAFSF